MLAIQLENISKFYGETMAVKDFSLDVSSGEFLFLLGPSGAGKSTVLRLIGGYELPSSGRIFIDGQDVTRQPVHQRNIGMVFQSYALFPHMTVAQNVAFGLKMRRVPKNEQKQRVREALQLVELDDLEQRYPKQLSGGQQQRVALARAFVYRPSLLLLDEPLANLDRRLRDTMRLELKQLQRRIGVTTIMVTHDQEESLSMADRVAVMHKGTLEQVDTPVEIYNRPSSPFVGGFIGEMNLLRGEVIEIFDDKCRMQTDYFSFLVATDEEARLGQVNVCLRAERLKLFSLNTKMPENYNAFSATLEFVSYQGASTLYLLRLDCGANLKVLETNESGQVMHVSGEKVTVAWPIEAAISFY